MTWTLADWKVACGLKPDSWTHERVVDGYTQIYWPGLMGDDIGWWWAIGTRDGRLLAGGWAAGNVRDRNRDIARGMLLVRGGDQAVA